jgi:nitrogen fixation protein NifB
METFRLVRKKYPNIILCVSTNGLAIAPHIPELAELNLSHVTITINAIDPEIGANVYAWTRGALTNRVFRGTAGAQALLKQQLEAITLLKERGITVKVNTIILPGINDQHIAAVAEKVKSLGADIMNCISFIPVADTPLENLPAPGGAMAARVRLQAKAYLPQMAHCARCRSDAVGLLGETPCREFDGLLNRYASSYSPLDERPYVAVATRDGILVNSHLGTAPRFQIYAKRDDGYELVATRPVPELCCGESRWEAMGKLLHDCRAILVAAAGMPPRRKLEELGLLVLDQPRMIQDGLDEIYQDEDLSRLRNRIGVGCPGPEDGVPGCG